jgi:hypothetical protein
MDRQDSKDRPLEVTATLLGEIRSEIAEAATVARQTWELVQEIDTRQRKHGESLAVLTARFAELKGEHDQQMSAGGCIPDPPEEEKTGPRQHRSSTRSASDLYRAVGAKVDEHVEQVEDSLTAKINLAALQAVKAAVEQEADARAAEVKRRTAEETAKVEADTKKKLAEAEAAIAAVTVRAARFKQFGSAIVALLLAIGGGIGWKSCATLETVQARTEATLKRIEIETKPKPAHPDIGVQHK